MSEILGQLKEMLNGLSSRFNVSAEKNIELTADYTKEETYLVSNLYITINFGILSVASFIFTSINLKPYAKFIVPFLLLSIISIFLEILIRKKTLEILRWGSAEKIKHTDEYNGLLATAFKSNAENYLKCVDEMSKVAIAYNARNLETNSLINERIHPYLTMRIWSECLMCGAVLSLFTIALIQICL